MKRKWGQHFLVRERYVQRMIGLASVRAGDQVLEIGPGRGVLTRALLEIGAFVKAVEIDPSLQGFLQQEFAGSSEFQLLCGDSLALPIEEILPASQPARIVANLPYNVATAIFFHLLPWREYWNSWTLMVQYEVAQRICTTAEGGKSYGTLSLAGSLGFERKLAFEVPPDAFAPPPKVNSAVVHLWPRKSGWSQEQEQNFLEFVRRLFQQRRKTLIGNLKQQFPNWFQQERESLEEQYLKLRPENLEFEDWRKLYEQFCEGGWTLH
ncbi:MAG: 16S rRNA (adenine(1518)-N(6)/adenine(1519)-N(6))-dimethyltransferase RsmA [SAR324 cluster bacterium]|nr:16S rRNA (adenine(1518)-N(6)/adenine(1519)-N(6))-dimethyltransferase RsmA [SAR324 cluster bacterium]